MKHVKDIPTGKVFLSDSGVEINISAQREGTKIRFSATPTDGGDAYIHTVNADRVTNDSLQNILEHVVEECATKHIAQQAIDDFMKDWP